MKHLRRRLVDGAKHGAAGLGKVLQDVDHHVGSERVEAARGLIEEEDGRFSDELDADTRPPARVGSIIKVGRCFWNWL